MWECGKWALGRAIPFGINCQVKWQHIFGQKWLFPSQWISRSPEIFSIFDRDTSETFVHAMKRNSLIFYFDNISISILHSPFHFCCWIPFGRSKVTFNHESHVDFFFQISTNRFLEASKTPKMTVSRCFELNANWHVTLRPFPRQFRLFFPDFSFAANNKFGNKFRSKRRSREV